MDARPVQIILSDGDLFHFAGEALCAIVRNAEQVKEEDLDGIAGFVDD